MICGAHHFWLEQRFLPPHALAHGNPPHLSGLGTGTEITGLLTKWLDRNIISLTLNRRTDRHEFFCSFRIIRVQNVQKKKVSSIGRKRILETGTIYALRGSGQLKIENDRYVDFQDTHDYPQRPTTSRWKAISLIPPHRKKTLNNEERYAAFYKFLEAYIVYSPAQFMNLLTYGTFIYMLYLKACFDGCIREDSATSISGIAAHGGMGTYILK